MITRKKENPLSDEIMKVLHKEDVKVWAWDKQNEDNKIKGWLMHCRSNLEHSYFVKDNNGNTDWYGCVQILEEEPDQLPDATDYGEYIEVWDGDENPFKIKYLFRTENGYYGITRECEDYYKKGLKIELICRNCARKVKQ